MLYFLFVRLIFTGQRSYPSLAHVIVDSEAWYTIDGAPPEGEIWDSIAGLYQTRGGEYVRIHTNFPQ